MITPRPRGVPLRAAAPGQPWACSPNEKNGVNREEKRVDTQESANRRACLNAAAALASRVAPQDLRLEDVAREAGLPAGTVSGLFSSAAEYLVAAQKDVFDIRTKALLDGVVDLPPGFDRLRSLLTLYLDYTLKHAKEYDWFSRAQLNFSQVAEEIRRRAETMDGMLASDLHGMRWAHPYDCAHLVSALLREIARREHQALQVKPAMRSALWASLDAMAELPA